MLQELLQITQGQPFLVFCLMAAIYWMQRGNADLIGRLHVERTQRLDALETAIQECERDRKALWEKLLENKH